MDLSTIISTNLDFRIESLQSDIEPCSKQKIRDLILEYVILMFEEIWGRYWLVDFHNIPTMAFTANNDRSCYLTLNMEVRVVGNSGKNFTYEGEIYVRCRDTRFMFEFDLYGIRRKFDQGTLLQYNSGPVMVFNTMDLDMFKIAVKLHPLKYILR